MEKHFKSRVVVVDEGKNKSGVLCLAADFAGAGGVSRRRPAEQQQPPASSWAAAGG